MSASRPAPLRWRAVLLLGIAAACAGAQAATPDGDPRQRNESVWRTLVAAEELVHGFDPALSRLGRSVRNLELPDPATRALFAASVAVTDLAPKGLESTGQRVTSAPGVSVRSARIAAPRRQTGTDLKIWTPFFDQVDYVQDAKFGVLGGTFADEQRTRFDHDLLFAAHALLRTRSLASVSGRVHLIWTRSSDADAADPTSWRIAEVRTERLDVTEIARPLFEEVLDRALPDPTARRAARESKHEELAAQFLTDGAHRSPYPYFTVQSHDRHPSVSVVDVDQDGYDDLYVMPELGRNQLFVNQRDGTFREQAAEYGLDIENHCSSAIFADFDNDGDPDVYIGRTLAPSMYLENQGGHFVDRSADLPKEARPALVASLSAADFDNDGLLDLYVATYAANIIQRSAYDNGKDPTKAPPLLAEFLAPADVTALSARIRSGKTNEFRDLPGPPNVLLKNVGGGRFAVPPEAAALRVLRNTYQAAWADFDGDGDEDLYLANDFAPHDFFRNDGHGRFTDITAETHTADIGFGMGVSWGDYDNDGRQDLYVSNMYSKAGSRITAQLPLDPAWAKMASGNTLFRNLGDTFQQVSGQSGDAVQVEIAGWSWSGQFADFNNDGYLDLFVPNGYYTAPEELALPVDI